jgi:hypothetical protein
MKGEHNMKFVKTTNNEYINLEKVSTLTIEPAFKDGQPLQGKYRVAAFIPFDSTYVLFIGEEFECVEYIDSITQ